jgi:hypothetical protein
VSTDSEDTQAADTSMADAAPDTVVVPDVSPTQGVQLAWSSDGETDDYAAPANRYTWGATWTRAGVVDAT